MKIVTARPHRLLDVIVGRIGEAAARGEDCMLLVPSQYTMQAELEIMERLHLPGTFQIDVLSPVRLQSRVFERAGELRREVFDERGKCMVLSKIIEEEKQELTIYRGAAENASQGFVSGISQIIADFKRSDATAQQVLSGVEKLNQEHPAARKLRDAGHLYAAYEQLTASRLADAEDVSLEMRKKLERSGVLDGQNVFVYGFDMITPTFAAELAHMDKLSRSLTLAVETDENAAADGALFAPVNYSLQRLEKLAKEQGIAVERERIVSQRALPEELCVLEQGLYALNPKPYAKPTEHIELLAYSNARAQAHMTGARIRRLMMEGTDAAQMAVVYPKGTGCAALLSTILPMYGVSAYIAEKRPAGAHPLCRFIKAALAVASSGWRTADVIECMDSGFLQIASGERDALCAYAEGVDLRFDGWKKPFAYIKNGTQEELDRLNAARESVVKPLDAFVSGMAKAACAEDIVQALLGLLDSVQAFETLERMRSELTQAGLNAEAEDCAQVWNALMNTLDQLHVLLGEERASAAAAQRLLRDGLASLELSALPPADGAVICGEIGNVRTAQVKILFALSMNDSADTGENGLLTQGEQEEVVRATGVYMGMSASERAALAQLDELKALSGATERVIVSYALADETGRALREGTAVQCIRRLFPKLVVRGGEASNEQREMLVCEKSALEALGVYLSDVADGKCAPDSAYAQAYAAIASKPDGQEKLRSLTRRLTAAPRESLDGTLSRRLYGRPVMSVSRLETFAQCPYRHFIRYGLSPREEQEPGVDRAELGTLYHEAADGFTRAAMKEPDFPLISDERCDQLMDEAVKPLLDAWRASPLGESRRGDAIARRVARTARRAGRSILSQYADSRFQPLSTELVFGRRGVAPIMLELADGSFVYLQGRIDRVDVLDGEQRRIRVIDYKSGSKKFDPTMAYWGIQLQLLIYLAAALSQLPGTSAAGFFYCRIADPTVKSESRIREEVEKLIAKKLSLAGVSLSDVEILRAQGTQHAQMITRDGKPSGRFAASMTDAAGMDGLVAFAKRRAGELAGAAFGGEIDDAPAERMQYQACTACRYAAICGFDPTMKHRRRLTKKTIEDLK